MQGLATLFDSERIWIITTRQPMNKNYLYSKGMRGLGSLFESERGCGLN